MKLATWNVNSLNVRLPQVVAWMGAQRPDVLCLQETKLPDERFPMADLTAGGYHGVCNGQKTYNGVCTVSTAPLEEAVSSVPGLEDVQKRVLAVTVAGVRIINAYVPNGESVESDKYQYKLRWFAAFRAWIEIELARHPRLAVVGDFNIAPEARDVYDPAAWEGKVLFSQPERDALQSLAALGLKDAFRLFEQPERSYTWWDYRMNMFRRKLGVRIDHILLSEELAQRCTACTIDIEPRRNDRPSDHAPVVAELNLE